MEVKEACAENDAQVGVEKALDADGVQAEVEKAPDADGAQTEVEEACGEDDAQAEEACGEDDTQAEAEEACGEGGAQNWNQDLGRRGERAAARFLEARGFEILERNWTCDAGEADIIARHEGDLVFVEVKTRSSLEHGLPDEAVDVAKRSRYERIAAYYLRDCDMVDVLVRFDVVSLLVVGGERALVRHHINAFSAG